METFLNFIMALVQYIQEMVQYIRAKNDGKDVTAPEIKL